MKKLLTLITVLFITLSTVSSMASASLTQNGDKYGDINNDTFVDIKDVLSLKKYLANDLYEIDLLAADVNNDEVIDAKDVLRLKEYLCEFPVVLGPAESTTFEQETTEPTTVPTEEDDKQTVSDIIENIENSSFSDSKVDTNTTYDEATFITLSDNGVDVNGEGISLNGNVIEITETGSYVFSGKMSDGQIYTAVSGNVYILLNGVDLTCKTSAPIAIFGSKKKVVTAVEGTVNTLTDSSSYTTFYNSDNDEPNACLFAKNSLTINGNGTLNVNANYNNGIGSKDVLKINDTTVNVDTTVGNAIKGNAGIILKHANVTVNSASDGVKSDSETAGEGYIICYNTISNINAIEDGFQAYSYLYFVGGEYTVKTGTNGATSGYSSTDSTSRKGIKCDNNLLVTDGDTPLTMNFNTYDDAIHCNNSVIIKSGTITISTADDAVHADEFLQVDSGTVNITKCYEGYEASKIVINGGNNSIISSDDGMNASDGTSSTGGFNPWGSTTTTPTNVYLQINGGYTYIRTGGDGVDSNSTITYNDGTVVVIGPSNGSNTCLDSGSGMIYNGGTILGISSSSAMWSQDVIGKISGSYIYNTNCGSISNGAMVSAVDENGDLIITAKMPFSTNIGIVFMTDKSTVSSCKFNLNGSFSGTLDNNGVATQGSITGGTNVSGSSSTGNSITTTRHR